ncbi:norsolorinic acid reductase [Lineolata rhizophorae]|uniref:Norsolorinic acid reductase n=1 Tax=Lineolata rhizophorae TaxID=578093 RepID=A0A6A6P5R3_9PEZI|nr:norsolorinic acid reductase [Lineolata rhizophorae]
MAFSMPPPPKSVLGVHRVLAPKAAVRVSPLCIGGMNFGENWKSFMGEIDKKTVFDMLDFFVDQGGNFIDTAIDTLGFKSRANNYQGGESEMWIGEWMKERKNRDQMVVATKYSTYYPFGEPEPKIRSNFVGNSAKSMHVSLHDSLRKLQTDYLDILYVHWWDYTTSIPELMENLHKFVQQGKVLYLGVSDAPAWVVSKANEYARQQGLTPFAVYQGKWSCADRDFERDIIPMCRDEGMALAPWGALGAGMFKTEEQRAQAGGRNLGPVQEKHIKMSEVLERVAKRKGTIITSVALRYVMSKTPNVFPIVGGRKVEHLRGNIESLKLELTKEDIEEIDSAIPFDIGFPHNFLFETGGGKYSLDSQADSIFIHKLGAYTQHVEHQKPLPPPKLE